MNGFWEDLPALVELFGIEGALRTATAAEDAIDQAASIFRDAGIDIWFRRGGHLGVSTSPVFDDHVSGFERALRGYPGVPEDLVERLSAEEVAKRCRSPRFRGGVFLRRGVTVQPARLARGLRRLVLDLGVHVYEETPVISISPGGNVRVATPAGFVTAEHAVLALNAWIHQIPTFRRTVIPRASHIVLTEPAPDRLEELSWTGHEGIYDMRATLHYLRTTEDGRIVFGAGTGNSARRIDDRFSHDPWWARRLESQLRAWFPPFRDVPVAAAWGGPIDVTAYHIPMFGSLWGGNIHFGVGFTGGGVGPCVLAGQILSSLALRRSDGFTDLPIVGYTPKRFPPEPLLSLGARLTLEAIRRTDDAWEAGRSGNPVLRWIARAPRKLGYNLGH
jgi:glycine/D-amino acid oxidase-like deaminating enzyme